MRVRQTEEGSGFPQALRVLPHATAKAPSTEKSQAVLPAAAVNYASGGDGAQDLAVADFNGDGIPDLVVANGGNYHNGQGGSVSVLLGNGDGTFQAAATYTAGLSPQSVTVGDFNGDGIPDFAVANYLSNDVTVFLGKGDGRFQAAVHYVSGPGLGWPSALKARDFNGDGIPDLVLSFAGEVRVLLGNGDGTFQTTSISYLAGGAYSVSDTPCFAVGDFNGDGLPDLAVGNVDTRSVAILINDGKWTP